MFGVAGTLVLVNVSLMVDEAVFKSDGMDNSAIYFIVGMNLCGVLKSVFVSCTIMKSSFIVGVIYLR